MSEHWIAGVNLVLAVFDGLPWLAPLLMRARADLSASRYPTWLKSTRSIVTQASILAINVRESPSAATRFAEESGMGFPVLLDRGGKVLHAYSVRAIPTSVFVDRESVIRNVHVGTVSKAQLHN